MQVEAQRSHSCLQNKTMESFGRMSSSLKSKNYIMSNGIETEYVGGPNKVVPMSFSPKRPLATKGTSLDLRLQKRGSICTARLVLSDMCQLQN